MSVDDSYTKSLLHFAGTDGSTTFTDESGKTWTPHGNAQLKTSLVNFPPTNGFFDGSGDYIDTPDHADFNLGSGDFTVEFNYIRNPGGGIGDVFVAGQVDSGLTAAGSSFYIVIGNSESRFYFSNGSSWNYIPADGETSALTPNHLAFVRNGNNAISFTNGSIDYGPNSLFSGVTIPNSAAKLAIGRAGEYAGTPYWQGYIGEFRFSVGIARWTSQFILPAYPYPNQLIASALKKPIIMFNDGLI